MILFSWPGTTKNLQVSCLEQEQVKWKHFLYLIISLVYFHSSFLDCYWTLLRYAVSRISPMGMIFIPCYKGIHLSQRDRALNRISIAINIVFGCVIFLQDIAINLKNIHLLKTWLMELRYFPSHWPSSL